MKQKLAALAALAPVGAFAAVPTEFTTGVTTAQTDSLSMIGTLIGLAVAVSVAMLAIAYAKKIRSVGK